MQHISFRNILLASFIGSTMLMNNIAFGQGSQLSIDPNLVEKVFESTARKQPKSDASTQQLGMATAIEYGYFKPTEFTLKNKYFSVPYDNNVSNFNLVVLTLATPFKWSANGMWSGFFSLGYAYDQDIYAVESENGLMLKDAVTLSWMPILGGVNFEYSPKSAVPFRPGFRVAAGVDWFSQDGQLDGMQQVFWVPHMMLGPQITIFPQTVGPHATGFEGINLSALYHQGVASPQKLQGWSANVGAKYAF